jgi:hypothetical protein
MTGAGAATVAFTKADGFLSEPTSPTYYRPGRNLTVDELSLDNALQRLREEQQAEAVDSLAQNLEGALSASWIVSKDSHQHVRDIVFNDDGGSGFVPGRTALSRWYFGLDYLTSGGQATAERVAKGVIPLSYSLSYEQGGDLRASLTAGYADEEFGTTITPSSVVGPSDGNDVPFHGAQFQVSGDVQTRLQSATLSFDNISRFHRGASRTAVDATVAAPATTLDLTAIVSETDQLELAYGSANAETTQDTLDSVTGQLSLDIDGSTVATYTLPKLKSNQYDWQNLASGDSDTTESMTWHVNGGVSIE